MMSLVELQEPEQRDQFVSRALELTRAAAGVAAAEKGFGSNNGVLGKDGDQDGNVDAWLTNARW